MDHLVLLLLEQSTFHEDQIIEAYAALSAVFILGTESACLSRAARRNPSRLCLRHAQLLPNLRMLTPWMRVYESMDDRAYITTMGIDVDTFHCILSAGFSLGWETMPIPREDTLPAGQPCLGMRSLDAASALGLILHYLGSAMLETSLQQIFAIIPSTVSRYLTFAKQLLLETLRQMPDAAIAFPKEAEFLELRDLIIHRHPLLQGAFGSIDALALPVQEADDPEIENATYNGWKSSHFISNVIAISPRSAYEISNSSILT
jgi:hypothetical protein